MSWNLTISGHMNNPEDDATMQRNCQLFAENMKRQFADEREVDRAIYNGPSGQVDLLAPKE